MVMEAIDRVEQAVLSREVLEQLLPLGDVVPDGDGPAHAPGHVQR